MIALLRGVLLDKTFSNCVIDVKGVGYEVEIPLSTFDKLPLEGEEVTLYIRTQVREDAITLFGFASKAEKELFIHLQEVNGVGGKMALNVLGAMPVANFIAAVESGDIKTLTRISGVGKRIAERMALELKGKLTDTGTSGGEAALPGIAASGNLNDAALALEKLGYKRDLVNRVISAIADELEGKEESTEHILQLALPRLLTAR